ncbi:MAG: 7-carboxy-7-deazaguanine synthase [Cyanobacteria bacterium P01_E01_bin.34]
MSYTVKELFYTLQGEGTNSGRAAVFCRFSGCNLWSGQELDRPQAVCQFCDTDFVGVDGVNGGRYSSAAELADAVLGAWQASCGETGSTHCCPLVVCTGGEPLLQLDAVLVDALHERGFEVAIETNGTQLPPLNIDHICVSPKAGAPLKLTHGHELKLVFPQGDLDPARFLSLNFQRFYLQPKDDDDRERNTQEVVQYCLSHPEWRLSLQAHKVVGIA